MREGGRIVDVVRGWVYVLLRIKSGAEGGIRANMGGWFFFLVAGNYKLAVEKGSRLPLSFWASLHLSLFSFRGRMR